MFLRKSKEIWNLFDMESVHFLTSDWYRKHVGVLQYYRYKSITVTNVLTKFSYGLLFFWCVFLFIQMYLTFLVNASHVHTSYSKNILNIPFPVTRSFYSKYYFLFYTLELFIINVILYMILLSDIIMILLCFTLMAQYNVITQAIEDIGYKQKSKNDIGKILNVIKMSGMISHFVQYYKK